MATRDLSGSGVGEGFDEAAGSGGGATQRFLIQMSDGSVYEAAGTKDQLALVWRD